MVYIHTMTMKRTNIYLTENQTEELRKRAYDNKWTISQVIRYAIDAYIQERKEVDTMSCIECGKEITGLHAKTLRGRYHVDCITKLADKLVEEQLLTVEARNGMIKDAIRDAETDAKIDDII